MALVPLGQTYGTHTMDRMPLGFFGKFHCFVNNCSFCGFSAPMICQAHTLWEWNGHKSLADNGNKQGDMKD